MAIPTALNYQRKEGIMKNIFKPAFFVFLFYAFLVSETIADDLWYDCIIKNVYDINDAGKIEVSGWRDQFIGGKFKISRLTGKIEGETLTTIRAKETRVINYGSGENSFKAVAEFDGQIQLIEIKVFKKGIKKPFIVSSMGGAGIVTGTCTCK